MTEPQRQLKKLDLRLGIFNSKITCEKSILFIISNGSSEDKSVK